MTTTELIKILKRFPKMTKVIINGNADSSPTINASVDQDGNWIFNISIDESKTSSK